VPKPIVLFVTWVDRLNRLVGRFAMLLFFVMAAIMLWSTISRSVFGAPVNWALEMTQFLLSAYYLLGGAYAFQHGAHVRMDLFYSRMSNRGQAALDAVTLLAVIFFLVVLLWGGLSSTQYAIQYGQKNYSSWAPLLWPVKVAMSLGIFLMLLQVIAQLLRDMAQAMGRPIT
jgi:TRAP-type mannitol/chloroaromatic compound transport system permease small subunit